MTDNGSKRHNRMVRGLKIDNRVQKTRHKDTATACTAASVAGNGKLMSVRRRRDTIGRAADEVT